MTETQLAYGRELINFAYDESHYQSLSLPDHNARPLTDIEVGDALDSPIESAPLEDVLRPDESVLVVVSDSTRATASAQIVNLLVRRVIQCGISPQDISIIFATGIHRPVSAKEKLELLTPFIVQRIKTIDHDAYDRKSLLTLGTTSRGTAVEVNRVLQEFSHIIITGGISFHYFAGFTGGRKSICPGLASAQTIEGTHMLALDFVKGGRRSGVGTALLDGNAVHQECERIAEMIKPSFGVNSIVDDRGRAVRLYAGDWRQAHRTACREYLAKHSCNIGDRRDFVIASCGGWPYDINLIQAHKALDMASYACKEGGTIILLAKCSEGFGRKDFLKWFEEKNSSALEARLQQTYEVNGQTAWSLLTKAEHYRVLLISDLADEDVKRMRMTPVGSLKEALRHVSPAMEGYILPSGAGLLPVLSDLH